MAIQTAPSPVPSLQHGDNMHHGLEEVAQYNATATFQPYDNGQGYHDQQQYSLPSQYGSPAPPMYHDNASSYPDPSQLAYTPPASLSPHPSTTRSGRNIRSPSDQVLRPFSSGVTKSVTKPKAKSKKKRAAKDPEKAVVKEALTTLLEHLKDVPETNIDAFVHRSIEVRRSEVENDEKKKIKRPMNAFMLYRKAWQNRVKAWQNHENHQGVSKVCGDAWNWEHQDVRDMYTAWARKERENHALAFPHYKFTPAKAKKVKARSQVHYSEAEESEVDLEWPHGTPAGAKRIYSHHDDSNDLDYRPGSGGGGRRSNAGVYNAYHQPPQRAMSHSPYSGMPVQQNFSHYQYSNPNKSMPPPYDMGGGHHYPQQTVTRGQYPPPPPSHHHAHHMPGSYSIPLRSYQHENVFFHQTSTPSYHQNNQGGSLPGSYHGSPVQQDPIYEYPPHPQQQQHHPMPQQHMALLPPQQQPLPQFDPHPDGFLSPGPNDFDVALTELNGGGTYEHDFGLLSHDQMGVVGGEDAGFVTGAQFEDVTQASLDQMLDPMLSAGTDDSWEKVELDPDQRFDDVLKTTNATPDAAG